MEQPSIPVGKLVLVIGPSGVGKSAILRLLKERHPDYHFPRSATTRAKRPGESDALYHFLSDEEFDRYIEEQRFLEWQIVHKTARYGTLLEEIIPFIDAGKTVVREVEVQGFDAIVNRHPLFSGPAAPYKLVSIFIMPESEKVLIDRIRNRAPISEEELAKRLESMRMEMTFAEQCTARVLNKDGELEATVAATEAVIESA